MDEKIQKERLEQELRFLKESFEAEVISKEEFEKGKNRVSLKLNELSNGEKEIAEKNEETIGKWPKEPKNETAKMEEEKAPAVTDPMDNNISEDKSGSRFFKYAAVFVVLILAGFFLYSSFNGKENAQPSQIVFTPVCTSDAECIQEGMDGACLNPNTKDAKCEFQETKINVLILNDRKNCFNCDTKRVLAILGNWFGEINPVELDYSTSKGKKLAEEFGARLLPMYILDENITKKPAFGQSKQAFALRNGSYALSDEASGSSFYIKRENIPNKLDFFSVAGDGSSDKAEKNLAEFLDTFKDVDFGKHLAEDNLTKELGIRNFPTFLVNNRVKFSGVLAAETIKENFCKMNKLPECSKNLSRSLV